MTPSQGTNSTTLKGLGSPRTTERSGKKKTTTTTNTANLSLVSPLKEGTPPKGPAVLLATEESKNTENPPKGHPLPLLPPSPESLHPKNKNHGHPNKKKPLTCSVSLLPHLKLCLTTFSPSPLKAHLRTSICPPILLSLLLLPRPSNLLNKATPSKTRCLVRSQHSVRPNSKLLNKVTPFKTLCLLHNQHLANPNKNPLQKKVFLT
mmetsp:Transcript_11562/g.16995  ORF Transcript_11562/g.16995 Transcript_11562/m.16995 type:complete len:206 (-) Transcript_11562:1491-2108(-)